MSGLRVDSGKGWRETTARREIAGILEVLRKLHRGQTLHRDLTPLNVFVCDGRRLKLGDFGIARPQSDRRGVTARTMNALTAPSDILARAVPKWQARDDVYQVGRVPTPSSLASTWHSQIDDRPEAAVGHALHVKRHRLRIHHPA